MCILLKPLKSRDVGIGLHIMDEPTNNLDIATLTIMEDYLRTNRCLEEDQQHMIRLLETKMIVDNEVMDKIKALYRVKEEYLEAVFDAIRQDYGSEEMFLKRALYMTPKAVDSLRKKYLV